MARPTLPLLILVGLTTAAHAQEPPPPPPAPTEEAKAKAKEHVDAGTRFYNVQQYDKAAEAYQQAYLLDPRPEYLYASAQSQRLGGDCTKALRSYDAYLRTNPSKTEQAKTQKNIERCQQDLKDHPPIAEPVTDPTTILQPEIPTPPPAPPPIETPVEPSPPPPPAGPSYLGGHVLLGSGIVVAAAGVLLYVRGKGAIDDHNASPTYDAFLDSRDDLDGPKLQQTLGVSAIAVGGGLILGGLVYYVVKSRSEETNTVSASVTRDQAIVTMTGSF